jgi:serine/threonine protein kinase
MGVVYKAIDTRLRRTIALKMLPSESADRERIERFEREAQAASALNHPNIVTIYDVGSVTGDRGEQKFYIAMEYIEGRTLRSAIVARDVNAAVEAIAQAAEGLARAHAAQIVHRDIKPENIMITSDGYAKVLDFGLAKYRAEATLTEDAATDVQGLTRTGMIVGTVGYMSPEQVAGGAIDHRSDIFSLGCVLYEALTGRQPFRGPSAVQTLHNIAFLPTPPLETPDPALARFEPIVRRMLAKKPDDRYGSAKEVARDLRGVALGGIASAPSVPANDATEVPTHRRVSRLPLGLIGLIVLVAIVLLLSFTLYRFGRRPPIDRLESMRIEPIPETTRADEVVISPDGKLVAQVRPSEAGKSTIVVRQLSTGGEVTITTEAGASDVTFSPDSESCYFLDHGSLYRVPVLGGSAQRMMPLEGSYAIASDSTRCAFSRDRSLYTSRMDGTDLIKVAAAAEGEGFASPAWSPDDRRIAFKRRLFGRGIHESVEIVTSDGHGKRIELAGQRDWFRVWGIQWTDGDSIVVAAGSGPLDPRQLYSIGISDGSVRRITNDLYDYEAPSVALHAKSPVIAVMQIDRRWTLWRIPRNDPNRATELVEGVGPILHVAAAADGRVVYAARQRQTDLWIAAANGTGRRRLTDGPGEALSPAISPDGKTIAYANFGQAAILWRVESDGTGKRALTHGSFDNAPTWSPEGRWIFYTSNDNGRRTIKRIPAEGGSPAVVAAGMFRPSASPDGRHLACVDENWEICIVSMADGKLERHFALRTGSGIRWSRDGRELLYIASGGKVPRIMSVPITGATAPVVVAEFPEAGDIAFDLTPDGASLLVSRESSSRTAVLIRDFR